DVAGVAAVRVGTLAPAGAVPLRGNDLPGMRPVLRRAVATWIAVSRVPPCCRVTVLPELAIAAVCGRAVCCWARGGVRDTDEVEVEPVAAGLHYEEDQLIAAVHPVAHGLGHGVGLVPDDRVADDPSVALQGEGYLPGQAEQVLRA